MHLISSTYRFGQWERAHAATDASAAVGDGGGATAVAAVAASAWLFGQIELEMLSYAKLDELGACIF